MTKSEFSALVAEKTGLKPKDASKAVDAVIAAIQETVANGDKVTLPGFGTFEAKERPAREGRNPSTGETIHIEASKVPSFKAGKTFKDAVKK